MTTRTTTVQPGARAKVFFLLLVFLSLCALRGTAQTVFAPPGASWHHTHFDGYVNSAYAGDTVTLGKTCSRIRQDLYVPPTSWATSFPVLYTYTSGDTVFVYNKLFSNFTPLYVFNVSDGDTVRIPAFHIPASGTDDTIFTFRVDSVRMVLYDTAMLRTVYTHTLLEPSSHMGHTVYNSYGHSEYGKYAERIGCVGNGIYPICLECAMIPEDCACIADLRCYYDHITSLKLTNGPCAWNVSTSQVAQKAVIVIYPDPARDEMQLTIDGRPCDEVYVMDMSGRVMSINADATLIDVSDLAPGIYVLRIKLDEKWYFHKLMKQ